MKKLLLTLLIVVLGIVSASAKTITITPASLNNTSSTYVTTAFDFTVDGYTFIINQVNPTTGQIRVNNTNSNAFSLYNTTAISGLKKVTLTADQSTLGTWYMKTSSSSAVTGNATTSDIKGVVNGKSVSFDVTDSSVSYFHINLTTKGSGTVKFSKIEIEYEEQSVGPIDPVEKVATPVISTTTGDMNLYPGDAVEITCETEGAEIFYDINSSEPVKYTGPITFSEDGVYEIGAYATKEGATQSELATYLVKYFSAKPIPSNLVVKYGDTVVAEDDVVTVTEGTQFEISADNTTTITIANFDDVVLFEANAGNCTWTPEVMEGELIYVTAKNNEGEISIAFELTVTASTVDPDPNPAETITHILTSAADCFNVTGTTYKDPADVEINGITYKAHMAGDKSSIQLRSNRGSKNNDTYSGIVVTANKEGYVLRKVVVNWNSSTGDTRVLDIYGSDKVAYSAPDDLYDSDKQGTLLGSIARSESTIEINEDYQYVGFRSQDGAMYISSLTLTWEKVADEPAVPVHPSLVIDGQEVADLETTIDLTGKEKVVIELSHEDPENHTVFHKFEAESAPAAVKALAEDNDGYTAYSEPIEITKAGTLTFYAQHNTNFAKSAARTITFKGETTAISEISVAEGNAEWFDIQGRRVTNPAKGGIYIRKQGSSVSKVAL